MYTANQVLFAFLLTLIAGLATGIGSVIAFKTNRTNKAFLALSLGFSAGVMIYVSFIEIFPKALIALKKTYSDDTAYLYTTLAFFAGVFLIGIIDKLIPECQNPHELKSVSDLDNVSKDKSLLRMGIFSALAIAIHNFPEGIATFTAALTDPGLGIGITVAIAIHNIPEGIAVSVPIYFATGSKKKAFKLSFLSGISEPLGAAVGYLILRPFLSDTLFGLVFAGVAGIMVFISLDELLPTAEKYGRHHLAIYGLIAGMLVMATSLVLI